MFFRQRDGAYMPLLRTLHKCAFGVVPFARAH